MTAANPASAYVPEFRVNSGRVELRGAAIKGVSGQTLIGGNAILPSLRPTKIFAMPIAHAESLTTPNLASGTATVAVGVQTLTLCDPQSSVPIGHFIFFDGVSWPIG